MAISFFQNVNRSLRQFRILFFNWTIIGSRWRQHDSLSSFIPYPYSRSFAKSTAQTVRDPIVQTSLQYLTYLESISMRLGPSLSWIMYRPNPLCLAEWPRTTVKLLVPSVIVLPERHWWSWQVSLRIPLSICLISPQYDPNPLLTRARIQPHVANFSLQVQDQGDSNFWFTMGIVLLSSKVCSFSSTVLWAFSWSIALQFMRGHNQIATNFTKSDRWVWSVFQLDMLNGVYSIVDFVIKNVPASNLMCFWYVLVEQEHFWRAKYFSLLLTKKHQCLCGKQT